MTQVVIAARHAADEYADGSPVATIALGEGTLSVRIGRECGPGDEDISRLTSQAVFELERLSEALIYVARGRLQSPSPIPSRDMLVGPLIHLRPSISCLVGLTAFYVTPLHLPSRRRDRGDSAELVVTAQFGQRGARATLEVADAFRLGEELYEAAFNLDSAFRLESNCDETEPNDA